MSRTLPFLTTRLALVIAALAVAVSLAVAATVQAADYPPKVQKAFTKSCVKSAVSGGLGKADAKKLCGVALSCIEDKLTLKQLIKLEQSGNIAGNKKVKSCIKRAAASVS